MSQQLITPIISFKQATTNDAETIVNLVNSAYRGDSSRAGWTTEADLLEGPRTNQKEIVSLIERDDSMVLLCLRGDQIVGSVNVEKKGTAGYLGLFVVSPKLQGGGIGKQFIRAAEIESQKTWGTLKMTMSVITMRKELITYYERRGYKRTGILKPFPTEESESIPQMDLQLETLEKNLVC